MTAHRASPVMKEPPIRPTPWPSQTRPTRQRMAPMTTWARTERSALGPVEDLELGEAVEPPRAVLDAEAAPLGPAEGLMGGEGEVGVGPRGAALETLGDLGRPLRV